MEELKRFMVVEASETDELVTFTLDQSFGIVGSDEDFKISVNYHQIPLLSDAPVAFTDGDRTIGVVIKGDSPSAVRANDLFKAFRTGVDEGKNRAFRGRIALDGIGGGPAMMIFHSFCSDCNKNKPLGIQKATENALKAASQRKAAQEMEFSDEEFAVLALSDLFPTWTAGSAYQAGTRLVHAARLYQVIQAVTALAGQEPDAAGMLAVYRPLSADPKTGAQADGSLEQPISFIYGMDVTSGLHYSHNGTIYLAKADMPACVWDPGTAGLWQWEAVG